MAKKPNQYSERLTIGFTPEQTRRLDELIRVRARRGKPFTKSDLVRHALNDYLKQQADLPGSHHAIAKGVEAKLDETNVKIDQLTSLFTHFVNSVRRKP